MKETIFNIIYIPDTVDYQSLALVSLLLNSNFSFRLVGNALKHDEARLLESIAQCSDRLSYINFESDFIIPHGTLLDILFHSENAPHYCFCDSDIFLFQPLAQSPQTLIGNNHVFSSAGRIENEDDATYAGFKGGATTISPDGKIALATSFFCIYKRHQLSNVITQYKVGFEQYRQSLQVPVDVQKILKDFSIDFDMLDTGKLLSILFYYEKYTNSHKDISGLVHLGGMSGRYLQDIMLHKTQVFDESNLVQSTNSQIGEFNQRNAHEISLKKLYGQYFYVYLHFIIGKSMRPETSNLRFEITETIKTLEQNIENIAQQANKVPELKSIIKLMKDYKK